jgi:hypothetical protein
MDRDPDQPELERLFLGVLARFTRGPEAEPLPFQTAVGRTLAIIYRREDEAVRAALQRVEAALMNSPEEARKIIRDERARLDRLAAEMDRILSNIDGAKGGASA